MITPSPEGSHVTWAFAPGWPGRRGRRWTLLTALATLLVLVGLAAPAAVAEPPERLDEQVTDTAGVLTQDRAQVDAALQRLQDETPLQLFVVFVDSFDGADSDDWAEETASLSGLGSNDVLLAVAVEDRAFSISDDPEAENALDDSAYEDVVADVEDRLADDDWSGAVVAAAEGYEREVNSSPLVGWVIVVAVVLVVGGVFLGVRALMRRRAENEHAEEERQRVERLGTEAGSALVALDGAITSAEQELGFATAEFAPTLTAPFQQTLETARGQAQEAYRLQAELGSTPEAAPSSGAGTRRADTLQRIIDLAGQAKTSLEEQASAFTEHRALADRAPERIGELRRQAGGVAERAAAASTALEQAGSRYAPAEVRLAAGVLDSVGEQLSVTESRLAEADGAPGPAAVEPILAAQDALTRAEASVARAEDVDALVQGSRQALAEAVQTLSADVADADRLVRSAPGAQGPADAARQVLTEAQSLQQALESGTATDGDPAAVVTRLAAAERELDAALATARAQEAQEAAAARQREQQDQQRRAEQARRRDTRDAARGGFFGSVLGSSGGYRRRSSSWGSGRSSSSSRRRSASSRRSSSSRRRSSGRSRRSRGGRF